MKELTTIALSLIIFTLSLFDAVAWNIPTHMVNGAITYQLLYRDSPATIPKVRAILEKNSWYADRWRDDITKLSDSQRDEMLFMLAARWADDIRNRNPSESHPTWHFINWPFKPEGEPESVKPLPPNPDNILTAFGENQRVIRSKGPDDKRGVALAWLFHLVGDIHQPLHTIQLFTREYPNGDRGGNEMCVRASLNGAPIELHRLWDGVITSSGNINRIRNIASDLLRRFSTSSFRELDHSEPEAWAKESYEIAVKTAYENGSLRGTPKGQRRIVGLLMQQPISATVMRLRLGLSRTVECTWLDWPIC